VRRGTDGIGEQLAGSQYRNYPLTDRCQFDILGDAVPSRRGELHAIRSTTARGLAFLVKGVVAPGLPAAFAVPAAYGDLTAAVLALVALAALRSGFGIPLVWVFNLWGAADLLNAFYQANASGLEAGMLQATYFIPTLIVPLLLITHVLVFLILIRRDSVAAAQ